MGWKAPAVLIKGAQKRGAGDTTRHYEEGI